MSTSPLDYQMSLRQINEGARRQEKSTKRKRDDKTTQSAQTTQIFTQNDVEKIANKEHELPFNDKNTIDRTKAESKNKTDLASQQTKLSKRIKENYKGNFLDIEVD